MERRNNGYNSGGRGGYDKGDRHGGSRGGYGGGDSGGFFAPVNVGDEVNVKIEAVGEKGDGVAKVKGFVIFVPNTQAGDEVKVKITRVLKKVGFGEVLGKADGPVSADDNAPQAEAPAEEAPVEESQQAEAPAENVEDTEDFGEEEKR